MNIAEVVEFLQARIAEDEGSVPYQPAPTVGDDVIAEIESAQRDYRPLEPGVLAVTTARVLADCSTKRQIIELVLAADDGTASPAALNLGDEVLIALAMSYAWHPDFREAWRA